MNSSALSQRVRLGFFFSVACLAFASASQGALLDGKTMRVYLIHQTTQGSLETSIDPGLVVVGPGVELEDFGQLEIPEQLPPLVDIDISDTQVLITLLIDQPPAYKETFQFIDLLNNIPSITNVRLNPASNWAGFQQAFISLGSTEVFTVGVAGLSGLAGQQILLDVIPEPATAGLMLSGLAAVTALGRRRCR